MAGEKHRRALHAAGVETELVIIKTSGDKNQTSSFSQMGAKGVFIKELEDALLDLRVDFAVHSMKDVPTEMPAGLTLAAICKREDVRDALLSTSGATLESLPKGARVGTSSLRRQSQLLHARNDLRMLELRGNVDTRIEKLKRGDYDAIILAKAGLDRLGLSAHITQVLPQEISLPAAGQGAIGIESRAADSETLRVLAQLNHAETRAAVTAERAALAGLEGGCQVSIGAWGRMENGKLALDVAVLSPDGSQAHHRKKIQARPNRSRSHRRTRRKKIARARRGRPARSRIPRDARMNPAKPLDGKRIVVTRAIEQARGLKDRLESMGAVVLLLPAVSFSEPADTAELDRAIQALESFDWILFTSANAVRFFAARCRKLGVPLGASAKPLCAAVGPATASAAAGEGLKIDYVAKEFLGTALARELSASLTRQASPAPAQRPRRTRIARRAAIRRRRSHRSDGLSYRRRRRCRARHHVRPCATPTSMSYPFSALLPWKTSAANSAPKLSPAWPRKPPSPPWVP